MTEIGHDLKSERLKQGLTLRDIFERTRISDAVIVNLEEGNYDKIGTPLLVRGFVRTYCAALGIDPEPILDRHAAEITACDRQQKGIKDYRRLSLAFTNRKRKWATFMAALAILVIGSIVATAWIAQKRATLTISQSVTKEIIPKEELPPDLPRDAANSQITQSSPAPQQPGEQLASSVPAQKGPLKVAEIKEQSLSAQSSEKVAVPSSSASVQQQPKVETPTDIREIKKEVPAAAASNSGESTMRATASETPNADQIQGHLLSAEASQEVWVQVKTDNTKTSNVLMKPGEKKEWRADESMQIVVGNAGGLNLQWDGKPLRSLGKSGAVVRFKLPDPGKME